ncbi:MAG: MGMT family protein [Microcella sp.]|uniref:MGMT family protein n=1 Tax=Microcella sp. TaxID=1913979 RepID=UPI0033151702
MSDHDPAERERSRADHGVEVGHDEPLDFAGAALAVVDDIPPGRVMTYGDVAAELGSRGARAVGRVMATEGGWVAWWRVVRADGRPPSGHEDAALEHYRAEQTPLRWVVQPHEREYVEALAYRLDLAAARHRPSATP